MLFRILQLLWDEAVTAIGCCSNTADLRFDIELKVFHELGFSGNVEVLACHQQLKTPPCMPQLSPRKHPETRERERGEKTETKRTCLFVALRGQENVLKTKSFVQCSVYQSLSPSVSFPFTSVKILSVWAVLNMKCICEIYGRFSIFLKHALNVRIYKMLINFC